MTRFVSTSKVLQRHKWEQEIIYEFIGLSVYTATTDALPFNKELSFVRDFML